MAQTTVLSMKSLKTIWVGVSWIISTRSVQRCRSRAWRRTNSIWSFGWLKKGTDQLNPRCLSIWSMVSCQWSPVSNLLQVGTGWGRRSHVSFSKDQEAMANSTRNGARHFCISGGLLQRTDDETYLHRIANTTGALGDRQKLRPAVGSWPV